MEQPDWMTHAWAEIGEREIRGRRDNPRILQFYKDAGHAGVSHDETAWCAAFLGACLERAGLTSTRSLMARSYLAWGAKLKDPRPGAITVLRRGKNTALGHVGFLVRATDKTLYLLGGNQSNEVKVSGYARSRLLGFRWPDESVTTDAEGLERSAQVGRPVPRDKDKIIDGVFERALAHVLEMEGGYTDDPHDPGGATNFGITIGDFARAMETTLTAQSMPELKQQLRRISPELVRTIYEERYWRRASCAEFSPPLALMHFDCAVNQGVARATKFLQAAVDAEVDGEIGPETIAAAAGASIKNALERYADSRRRHYRGLPHFWRFGRGWLRRLNKTSERSKELIGVRVSPVSVPAPQPQKETDDMTKTTTAATGTKPKWWGESITIWGAVLTAVSTVVPALAPLLGLEISADVIQRLGAELTSLVSAAGGVIGIVMTIFGRARATSRLQRREIKLTM